MLKKNIILAKLMFKVSLVIQIDESHFFSPHFETLIPHSKYIGHIQ